MVVLDPDQIAVRGDVAHGDWPRKHPLLASLADPDRDSLLNRVVDAMVA